MVRFHFKSQGNRLQCPDHFMTAKRNLRDQRLRISNTNRILRNQITTFAIYTFNCRTLVGRTHLIKEKTENQMLCSWNLWNTLKERVKLERDSWKRSETGESRRYENNRRYRVLRKLRMGFENFFKSNTFFMHQCAKCYISRSPRSFQITQIIPANASKGEDFY